jgi:hypothetical protein
MPVSGGVVYHWCLQRHGSAWPKWLLHGTALPSGLGDAGELEDDPERTLRNGYYHVREAIEV